MNKKRNLGLICMYILLLIISSLLQQMTYYGVYALMGILVAIVGLVILWKTLLKKKIITISWSSVSYEQGMDKSERLFLCSLVFLISPLLSFHDLSVSDIVVTGIAIMVGVMSYLLNERRYR
jgi:hypothetical protein